MEVNLQITTLPHLHLPIDRHQGQYKTNDLFVIQTQHLEVGLVGGKLC